MGSPVSAVIANLYMEEFEERAIATATYSYSGSVLWNGLPACLWRCGKIKRHKFRLTNNLISDILFLHAASLKSRCFLFIFIILVSFILVFRLVRKLVFSILQCKCIPEGNTVFK